MEAKGTTFRLVAQAGSAAAVALSLVFVGLEVRETARQTALNTTSLEVAAYQELIRQINEFNQAILDPEIAALYELLVDPSGDWAELSAVDERRARSLFYLAVRHADMAFHQHQRGMLSAQRLESAIAPSMGILAAPMGRIRWEEGARDNFAPDFREYIDGRLEGA